MPRPLSVLGVLLTVAITSAALPAWAQTDGEARLGGGSDISPETTVQLPQGGLIPPLHRISADNPGSDPIQVEFQARATSGIVIDPEWVTEIIPAGGSVINRFAVEVSPNVAPGRYPVVIQLVRSDIESEPGRITNIPAIQASFTVEVVGESAAVTVRSVSAHSGEPVTASITLSARMGDEGWFEIDRAQADTLQALVAPGEYRAAVLLGEREVEAEEFTVEADQTVDVVIEVETVSFVVVAVRRVTEQDRLVVVELVAAVNNEIDVIAGSSRMRAVISHEGVEVDTITIEELSELPRGTTEATATYRPDDGWEEGSYQFAFELVTPVFTLTAVDRPVVEVPAMGIDLLGLIAELGVREEIALIAAVVLGLVFVEEVIRFLMRRRRRSGIRPTRSERRATRTEPRPVRRHGRRRNLIPQEPSWLEDRISPVVAGRSRWSTQHPTEGDTGADSTDSPSPHASDRSLDVPTAPDIAAASPNSWGSSIASGHPPAPAPDRSASRGASAGVASGDRRDTAHMVEALRVIQRLHDDRSLAPGWSITEATLVYWAMISPGVHQSLSSVGMTEEEYGTAMRRLFSRALLDRSRLPSAASKGSRGDR